MASSTLPSRRRAYAEHWPPPRVPVDVARAVREEAVRLLEERGWCQHSYELEDGRPCMSWALIEARRALGADARGEDWAALQIVGELGLWVATGSFDDDMSPEMYAIAEFNDRSGQTFDRVIEVLRPEETSNVG